MTTKEKLDLLWKYLLLIVLAYGVYQMGSHQSHFRHHSNNFPGYEKMIWMQGDDDADMDIDVQVEKLDDGDSTIVVKINGETIDLEGLDIESLDDLDAKVFVKKIEGGKGEKRQIRIIKEEIDED